MSRRQCGLADGERSAQIGFGPRVVALAAADAAQRLQDVGQPDVVRSVFLLAQLQGPLPQGVGGHQVAGAATIEGRERHVVQASRDLRARPRDLVDLQRLAKEIGRPAVVADRQLEPAVVLEVDRQLDVVRSHRRAADGDRAGERVVGAGEPPEHAVQRREIGEAGPGQGMLLAQDAGVTRQRVLVERLGLLVVAGEVVHDGTPLEGLDGLQVVRAEEFAADRQLAFGRREADVGHLVHLGLPAYLDQAIGGHHPRAIRRGHGQDARQRGEQAPAILAFEGTRASSFEVPHHLAGGFEGGGMVAGDPQRVDPGLRFRLRRGGPARDGPEQTRGHHRRQAPGSADSPRSNAIHERASFIVGHGVK